MYKTRIYNGVNHSINLYETSAKITSNRKGQYFLTHSDAKPDKIIQQMKPISVRTELMSTISINSPVLFLPEAIGSQLDILPNFYDFDIIAVSTIYAGVARQLTGNNPDYLDRLYTPIPVFVDDPQTYGGRTHKAGSVGFRKVWYPRTPQEYVLEFRAGRLPSVSSMKVCFDIYNSHRAYCDTNTAAWLMELRNWMPAEAEGPIISA